MARSHSGPLTRGKRDKEEEKISSHLESYRSRLDYHDRLREELLDARSSVMKHHNDHVLKTKSDYE